MRQPTLRLVSISAHHRYPLGDSLFDPSTSNRYAYTKDDPTNLIDRSGYNTFLSNSTNVAWFVTGTCALGAFIAKVATAGVAGAPAVVGFEACAVSAGFTAGVGSLLQVFTQ